MPALSQLPLGQDSPRLVATGRPAPSLRYTGSLSPSTKDWIVHGGCTTPMAAPISPNDPDLPDAQVRDLILQFQSGTGSEEAFEQVFRLYFKRVFRFFIGRGWSSADAQELTQETFLRVFEHLGQFRYAGPFSFDRWLFIIMQNLRRSHLRRLAAAKRHALVGEESLEALDVTPAQHPLASPGADPLDQTLEHERLQTLRGAVKALPTQMRQAVILRLYAGMKYREIAVVMQISIETVKAHLHQAQPKLKAALQEQFSDFDL